MTAPRQPRTTTMNADITATLRWLSGLALVSPAFLATPSGDAYRWLDMSVASSAVVIVAGLLGLAASTGRAVLAVAAGGLCLAAALTRLIGLARHATGPIGGNGSTMTFLAGLGIGFLVLGLAHRLRATGE
jgi:hypothetical protein